MSDEIGMLEEHIKENPDSDRFAELAEYYIAIGRYKQALQLCERGIGYHPDLAAGHLLYGKALLKLGNLEEGNQAFRRACALRINDVAVCCEVGQFLVDEGQAEAAYPYLKKGLQLDPRDPRIIRLEENIVSQKESDHERIETRPISVESERTLASQPLFDKSQEEKPDKDPDSWREPTERLDWPEWESHPPPAEDALAPATPLPDIRPPPDGEPQTRETLPDLRTDSDDEDGPPTLYVTNPLQAGGQAEPTGEDDARTLLLQPEEPDREQEEPELIDLPEEDEFSLMDSADSADSQVFPEVKSKRPPTQPVYADREETILDPSAGLRAEVSDAFDRAVVSEPESPPTIMNPEEQGPQPWTWAPSGPQPSSPGEPPTMLEGEQEKRKAALPPLPHAESSGETRELKAAPAPDKFATPAETFSYLKVFLVLVPFLVVGLGLGGYVAFRHIKADKIAGLLDRANADIQLDTFRGYSEARVTLQELQELDEGNSRGRTLLALVSSRLHQEYGPNLALRDESTSIVQHPPRLVESESTGETADLLWARFHLLQKPLREPDVYNASKVSSDDPGLASLAEKVTQALSKSPKDPSLLALAGELAAAQGRPDKAISLFEENLTIKPSEVRSLYALARLQDAGGKPKKAVENLERALIINRDHTKSLLLLSRLRLRDGKDLLKVKADLDKVFELSRVTDRRKAEAHLLSAHLAFERYERSSAVKQIDSAAKLAPEDAEFLARLASLCREYYELKEAAALAKKSVELNPDDIMTRLLLIGSKLLRGQAKTALAALDDLAGKKVPAVPFLILRGEALLLAGRLNGALNDLVRIPNNSPEYPRARALAVLSWLAKGNQENAYREVSALASRHPRHPLVHYALGEYRQSKRLHRSAAAAYNKAVALDPRCYQALSSLAWMAHESRKYKVAEELAGKALAANPYDTRSRLLLGQLKLDANDYQAALDNFARLVKELPSSKEGLAGMAEALLLLNRNDQALLAIDKARRQGATDAHALHIEGRIHLALGKYFPAVRALVAADREKKKDAEILADLGLAQLGARSYTKAERSFKDSLKRSRLFRAQEGLARLYLKKRKYKDAAKAFEKAAYLAAKNDKTAEEVASLYMQGGQAWVRDRTTGSSLAQARRLFRRAARVVPSDPEPHYQIAAAFDRDEKLNAARQEYLKVLEMNPAHASALYRLGLLEFDVGNDQKAREYLDRFMQTKPTGKEAKRAQQLLKRMKSEG